MEGNVNYGIMGSHTKRQLDTYRTSIALVALWMLALGAGSASAQVTISLDSMSATLFPSQMQKFTATVKGTQSMAVTWNFSPATGSLPTSGNTAVYTAPAII